MKQKKRFRMMLVLSGAFLPAFWAVSLEGQQAPDLPKLRQEIKVMESIVSTTLSFVGSAAEDSRRDRRLIDQDRPQVRGIYLMGQGVLFAIPSPRGPELDPDQLVDLEGELADVYASGEDYRLAEARIALSQFRMQEAMNRVRRQERELARQAEMLARQELGDLPEPPEPPVPPAPEVAPAPTVRSEEERRERFEQMKAELAALRKRAEASAQQIEEYREKLDQALVEVVARHGDSLTQLSDQEYVNFLLVDSFGPVIWGHSGIDGTRPLRSVKMSDVRALKSGGLSMAEFRSRVRSY